MLQTISDRMTSLRFFGVDIFALGRKYLVFNLVSRNLRLKYRQSYLGILWTMLVPLSTALMYYMVFKFVAKFHIDNQLLFVVSGVFPWMFFASAITLGMESIVAHQQLINKTPIPPLVFPLTETISAFISFLFSLPILIGVAIYSGTQFAWGHLYLVLLFGILFIFAYCMALLLGMFFVYFRDLRHIVSTVLQIWFYATPVIYQLEMLPEDVRHWFLLNPMVPLLDQIHNVVIFGHITNPEFVIGLSVFSVALLFLTTVIYSRMAVSLPENL